MGGKILACIRCGSTSVSGTPGDGNAFMDGAGFGAIGGLVACRDCGRIGVPIEFSEKKAYEKFLKVLKRKS